MSEEVVIGGWISAGLCLLLAVICLVLWPIGGWAAWSADTIGWIKFLAFAFLAGFFALAALSTLVFAIWDNDSSFAVGARLGLCTVALAILPLCYWCAYEVYSIHRLLSKLDFIAETLNNQAELTVTVTSRDAEGRESRSNRTIQKGSVKVEDSSTASCKLGLHWKTISDEVISDADETLPVGQITTIEALVGAQAWLEKDIAAGRGTCRYETNQPLFVVRSTLSDNRYHDIFFVHEDKASIVWRALVEAAELCTRDTDNVLMTAHRATGRDSAMSAAAVTLVSCRDVTAPLWTPEHRLALVIGNSGYGEEPAWPDLQGGPIRDADETTARLKTLGFEVVEVKDGNLEQMSASLERLAARIAALRDNTLALFYYSGHGTRAPRDAGEDNYLVPVHSQLDVDVDATSHAISLTQVTEVLKRARAGVVILDACRNDGLRRGPSQGGALARGFAPAPRNISGLLFAFSTAAGEMAENRPGQMSHYTELLVRDIGRTGESLTTTFRTVRKQMQGLGYGQSPELVDQLNDDIVLVPQH